MTPRRPNILVLLLQAGALLPGLFADQSVAVADEPDRGVLQDEVFLLASVLWT